MPERRTHRHHVLAAVGPIAPSRVRRQARTADDGPGGAGYDLWAGADYGPLGELLAPAARRLVALAAPEAGDHVLDLAAGLGSAAEVAAGLGARVTAVDRSPAMVAGGRERLRPLADTVRWLEGAVEDVPLGDASCDLVVSSFGLIFAVDPDRAIAELVRVLRPGGGLAFSSWTGQGLMGRMSRAMAGFLPAPPARRRDAERPVPLG